MKAIFRNTVSAIAVSTVLALAACGTTHPSTQTSTSTANPVATNAQAIAIGFNGPDVQIPYMDQFYAAQTAYYQSIGATAPTGTRCHAYLSWDIAQQPVGSGPVGTEGSRAWFEDWLSNMQGHCTEALITFKYISGITISATPPTNTDYQAAIAAFLGTSWSYTGWTGTLVYEAWNEPNGAGGAGDGYTVQLTPQQAADYYLVLRSLCTTKCSAAAGALYSNGQGYLDFVQNCADDTQTPCYDASYIDQYKYYIVTDAPTFGLPSTFRPEIFSYHDWDDTNDYQNDTYPTNQCESTARCTTRALLIALGDSTWSKTQIWDTEVAAGQDPQSNPTDTVQACTVSFLLRLTAGLGTRITRIYYTQPYIDVASVGGEYGALFDATGAPRPAFAVLADRDVSYQPAIEGTTCP
jgi:hypothetical protein